MATKQRFIEWFKKDWHWLFFAVAGVFLLLHIFFFRGILPYIGDIASNNASVVRDELVPFFGSDQYLPDDTGALTGADEFRVVYSFWTSWVRQNTILPFALILLNTLSAYLLFYAIFRITKRLISRERLPMIIYASALGAIFVHIILLYAKVGHFYTLIFGFSLFALSLSLLLEQIFFKKSLSVKNILFTSALVLINPAIHYHVIFYVALLITLVAQIIILAITKSEPLWKTTWRNIKYALIVTALSLIPYLIFIRISLPSTDAVFNQTPINYWIIYYSSVPLRYLFSLDTYSHLDFYRYGSYLAASPRYLMVIGIIIIAGSTAFLMKKRLNTPSKKHMLIALLLLVVISIWMSLGYRNDYIYSFHELLSSVSSLTAHCGSFITDEIGKLLNLFVNILRFPHRFEFIMYYALAILFTTGLLAINAFMRSKHAKPVAIYLALLFVTFLPILCTADYRDVMLSGDFAGYFKPYKISDDLKNIKSKLAQTSNNKMFILPSLDSGRELKSDGTKYSFLDKYLIYYLNQPSIYYGSNVGTANKVAAYMTYYAINNNQQWWQDILINNLNVTHILVPKNLQSRDTSITYMPGIEEKVPQSLASSNKFERIYEGQDFDLYSSKMKVNNSDPAVLTDYSWANFLQHFNSQELDTQSQLYFPIQLQKFINNNAEKIIKTDNLQRTYFSLMSTDKAKAFYPSSTMLPFTQDLVPSSVFDNSAFALSYLADKTSHYNYLRETVPSILNLPSGQFIGLLKRASDELPVKLQAPQDGDYTLVIHAATNQNKISAILDDKKIAFTSIDKTRPNDYLDFTYFTASVHLTKGQHCMVFTNQPETLLVENVMTLPQDQVPTNFSGGVETPALKLTPTGQQGEYNVTLKK